MLKRKQLKKQADIISQLQIEIEKLKDEIQTEKQNNIELKKEIQVVKQINAELKDELMSVSKPNKRMFGNLELTDEQAYILDLLENTNKNYFITGRAGTGKSTVLNCFKATTRKKDIAVVAPTGAAAINIGGETIHSLFRMSLDPQDTKDPSKVKVPPYVAETLKAIKVLIIDEISMVRADIMDMMDARLKLAKKNDLPFGGCQIIAFGDLYQLSPIASDRVERKFIEDIYGTLFFFGAPSVDNSFEVIEMTQPLRQTDIRFIELLNKVRDGSISEAEVQYINANCGGPDYPQDCLRLTLTKDYAKRINIEKLSAINKPEYRYKIELGGDDPPKVEDVPCDFDLRLKVGAKVMMTRNHPARKYINGSIGTVTNLSDDSIQVEINGVLHDIEQTVYPKKKYYRNPKTGGLESEVVGWAKQYPIRLAYAITAHKAQGATYDNIVIDFSDRSAFAAGQTYVALSRCKTLKGVYLPRPLTKKDIYICQEVVEYMSDEPCDKENDNIEITDNSLDHEYNMNWLNQYEDLPF